MGESLQVPPSSAEVGTKLAGGRRNPGERRSRPTKKGERKKKNSERKNNNSFARTERQRQNQREKDSASWNFCKSG